MDDFTKIKLINSLIDVVDRFYSLKDEREYEDSLRLKGFCEGLSYALVEIGAIDKDEAKQIMNGLGKKQLANDKNNIQIKVKKSAEADKPIESNSTIDMLKEEVKELNIDIQEPIMHSSFVSLRKDKSKDLDLPAYIRKNKINTK